MARLGELLIREKVINSQQLQMALDDQKRTGNSLASTLTHMGIVPETVMLKFFSKQYQSPIIQLNNFSISADLAKLVSKDLALKYCLIPISKSNNSIVIAMADPSNVLAIDDLKFFTKFNIETRLASEQQILQLIYKTYNITPTQDPQENKIVDTTNYEEFLQDFSNDEVETEQNHEQVNTVDLEKSAQASPVIRLVNLILINAIQKNASDIHIEPYETTFRVRYRIDGSLYQIMEPPLKLKNALISRLKIMSSLDISERRLPQDGRIKLKLAKNKEMDYRVSILPTLFGEKCVLRLLDKSNLQLDMTKLGFEEKALHDFKSGIHQPYGIVLVTGPTGSGKTTTLYSALSELNKTSENISTAEDPVEFNLPGINQVQMHEAIGLNFSAALRSFLRQDPDIIMVGEIRDFETCEIAIKSALTGHLVLSTLHTNDAPSTISRILNMGIEPFLICAALNVVVAQRLVRKICKECKKEIEVSSELLRELQVPEQHIGKFKLYKGQGCDKCSNTGSKGRIAIYEVMTSSETIKELILQGASNSQLKAAAIKGGMKTLRQAAISKLIEGEINIEEITRVTAND